MEKSIIIRNLPEKVYVPELCETFKSFGNIIYAAVFNNDSTISSTEGYIEFDHKFSALKAANSASNFKIRNISIKVFLASENDPYKKIFVKNFSPEWDECDLLTTFECIGSVETVKISEENGKSNGYGFVVFNNHYTAKRAVQHMNGKEIGGLKLIVERFQNKSERDSLKSNSLEYVEKMLQKSVQLNNLYIKNLPINMSEDQLTELFERFGDIISVKIVFDEKGVSKGFGFVCFENVQDAERALERMNGYPLKGKKLQIYFKEDGQLRKQYNSLKNKEKDLRIRMYKQRAQSMPRFMPDSLKYKGKSNMF